jgi:hypothetical protein
MNQKKCRWFPDFHHVVLINERWTYDGNMRLGHLRPPLRILCCYGICYACHLNVASSTTFAWKKTWRDCGQSTGKMKTENTPRHSLWSVHWFVVKLSIIIAESRRTDHLTVQPAIADGALQSAAAAVAAAARRVGQAVLKQIAVGSTRLVQAAGSKIVVLWPTQL